VSTRTMLDRYQTSTSYLARILHRFSGFVLTVYVLVYIWQLGAVRRGGVAGALNVDGFNATMASYNTPFWKITHALVIALVVLHSLTGLRVLLFEAGVGLKVQKASFWLSFVITVIIFVLLFIKIIGNLAA